MIVTLTENCICLWDRALSGVMISWDTAEDSELAGIKGSFFHGLPWVLDKAFIRLLYECSVLNISFLQGY